MPPRGRPERSDAAGAGAGDALDLVLDKIAREGMASLDADDRALLEEETARRRAGD
jgi:hypothetical protein